VVYGERNGGQGRKVWEKLRPSGMVEGGFVGGQRQEGSGGEFG